MEARKTIVNELNELAYKMTGVNPKATTDAGALNYIEQNYQGGGSSGSDTIVLNLGNLIEGYEKLGQVGFIDAGQVQFVNVNISSYVEDFASVDVTITQDQINNIEATLKEIRNSNEVKNIIIIGNNEYENIQQPARIRKLDETLLVEYEYLCGFEGQNENYVEGISVCGVSLYNNKAQVDYDFRPFPASSGNLSS